MALAGAGVLLVAALVAVFWFFFYAQVRSAYLYPSDWGHTLVIPILSGYFIWLKRHEILAEPFKPAWSGLLLMLIGIGIYFLGYLGPKSLLVHSNARGAGVGMTVFGIALLLFGWRAMRYLWFPLLYWVLFGQTISDGILKPVTERMQDVAARGAWVLLNLVGIDTEREGNVLNVYSGGEKKPLNVAEACSGMRMLLAFLALGVAIAHTGLDRWWQKGLLIAAGIPVAIGVNILRVMTLGVLSLWNINFAAGNFHHVVGLVWLLPAFVLYLGILWVLRNVIIEDERPLPPPPEYGPNYLFRRSARVAYVVAFGTLFVGAFAFMGGVRYLNYYVVKEPVNLRSPLDTVPPVLGRWQKFGQDDRLSDAIVEELGTKQYLSRLYALDGNPRNGVVELHMAYYTGTIDDVPHIPDRCWNVAGFEQTKPTADFPMNVDRSTWERSETVNRATGIPYDTVLAPDPITGRPTTAHMPIGDLELRITEFQSPKQSNQRLLGGYLFIANGRVTPNPYDVRALAFERSERFAYYCKVQFSMRYNARDGESDDAAIGAFRQASDELMSSLLPHLMTRLPDWPEVERRSAKPAED
jgi:exosortase